MLIDKFEKFKNDENFNYIINELAESLIFDKMYMYLYLNFKQFNKEEEKILKEKIKNIDFNFISYKLDASYNECKFENSIKELKKITLVYTPFEKLKILINTYHLIEKEIKECFDKSSNTKIKFSPSGENLWPIWTYLLINADIKNLLTEMEILRNFKIKDSYLEGVPEFHMTNFFAAIEHININEKEKKQTSVSPYIITSNNHINADKDFSFGNLGKSTTYINNNNFEDDRNKTSSNITSVNQTGIMGTFRSMFS
jgi:hypothetical protein